MKPIFIRKCMNCSFQKVANTIFYWYLAALTLVDNLHCILLFESRTTFFFIVLHHFIVHKMRTVHQKRKKSYTSLFYFVFFQTCEIQVIERLSSVWDFKLMIWNLLFWTVEKRIFTHTCLKPRRVDDNWNVSHFIKQVCNFVKEWKFKIPEYSIF